MKKKILYLCFVLPCSLFFTVDPACAQLIPPSGRADSSRVVFPIKASSNSRYLVDQSNKPFPILGRTAWFVISLPVSGYQTFIGNCISHGNNSIEMHVLDRYEMSVNLCLPGMTFHRRGQVPSLFVCIAYYEAIVKPRFDGHHRILKPLYRFN